MQIRAAATSALVALVSIGSVLALATEPRLGVSGTVVSTGNTSIAVKSDDDGRTMSFLISTTTLVPAGLSVGSRVSVAYHPVGATAQMAETVTLLDTAPSRASSQPDAPRSAQEQQAVAPPSQSSEPSQSAGPNESTEPPAAQLPATASLLPLVGLIALVALLGSLSLRALERRRS